MGGLLLHGFIFCGLFRPTKNLRTTEMSVVETKETQRGPDLTKEIRQSPNSCEPDGIEHLQMNGIQNEAEKSVQCNVLETKDNRTECADKVEPKNTSFSLFAAGSLLRDPAFIMFSLQAVCQFLAFGIFYAFIKAFALSKGVDSQQATYIVSMSGLAELCGNLVLPLISDFPFIRKIRLYLFMLFSIGFGVLYAVYPMVTDYSGLLLCVFVTVFMTSQVHTLRIPFAITVTGTKETNLLIGLTTLFSGIGQAIGPIIGGNDNKYYAEK